MNIGLRTSWRLWTLLPFLSLRLPAADVERNGVAYSTFVFPPEEVELCWLDEAGTPLRQFQRAQSFLERRGRKVEFLMNAGIFESGGIPSGLLIIGSKILRPLKTADGSGNFYLKPNGVFFVDERGGSILSTEDYRRAMPKPRLAIQSGPLLLQHGQTHPAFRAPSTNYLHRNGVGILADGAVLFAVTQFGQRRYPNLFEFADFFRSRGCRDALFLDGDISQVVVQPKGPIKAGNAFGAIFAVTKPAP
jgi:uncharacterized protein YigE (DUF2233 family)